ncbi:NOP58 family protein [Candidatus Woesearchaeota archaeon]|nr:NOP58 family protein [Candidatus Woesearchaeota archaeon]
MKYLFIHVLGYWVMDHTFRVVEQVPFSTVSDYKTADKLRSKLIKKYPDLQPLPLEKSYVVLELLKNPKYFEELHERNVLLTKQGIKAAVSEDWLIMQAIANVNELDRVTNLLVKRLREWYSLYFPELAIRIFSNEKFVDLVISRTKSGLITELKVKETMGADLNDSDVEEILLLAQQTRGQYRLREQHEQYLRRVMQAYCPNLMELAGVTIGAKLIELGRGLKNLALLPASTIQLLGAEKALFRHLKTGSQSPKYGILFSHPLVQKARLKDRGKVSRALADKLSLCARLDYFKGGFKANEYKKELEERFSHE